MYNYACCSKIDSPLSLLCLCLSYPQCLLRLWDFLRFLGLYVWMWLCVDTRFFRQIRTFSNRTKFSLERPILVTECGHHTMVGTTVAVSRESRSSQKLLCMGSCVTTIFEPQIHLPDDPTLTENYQLQLRKRCQSLRFTFFHCFEWFRLVHEQHGLNDLVLLDAVWTHPQICKVFRKWFAARHRAPGAYFNVYMQYQIQDMTSFYMCVRTRKKMCVCGKASWTQRIRILSNKTHDITRYISRYIMSLSCHARDTLLCCMQSEFSKCVCDSYATYQVKQHCISMETLRCRNLIITVYLYLTPCTLFLTTDV